jgi:MFS family permease
MAVTEVEPSVPLAEMENEHQQHRLATSSTAVKRGRGSLWELPIIITALCLAIFLLGLDMNIIGVAIPRITTDFKSLKDIAWYGSAYLLTVTAFQPFFGTLFRYFNPKYIYITSIVVFEGDTISIS